MAEAADNTTTTATAAAKLVISSFRTLLPILLNYAIKIVKLTPFLSNYLLKFLAACFDELRADLLSSLDGILPPGKRIDTLHHYLIIAMNEISPIVKYYFDFSVAKLHEIYPLVKQYILTKSEISIRSLQGLFDDVFPPGEREEALWKFVEAGKQYMAVKSEVLIAELKHYFDFLVAKFHEIYPHVRQDILIKSEISIAYLQTKFDDAAFSPALWEYIEAGKQYLAIKLGDCPMKLKRFLGRIVHKLSEMCDVEDETVKSGDWTVELKRFWGCTVHKVSLMFGVEDETVKLVVTACIVVCISLVCVRLCSRARGRGRMMTAPGRGRGVRIRRGEFERNPKGYFKNLRDRR